MFIYIIIFLLSFFVSFIVVFYPKQVWCIEQTKEKFVRCQFQFSSPILNSQYEKQQNQFSRPIKQRIASVDLKIKQDFLY